MVLIAVGLLTAFPPGIFFPQMAARMNERRAEKKQKKQAAEEEKATAAAGGPVDVNTGGGQEKTQGERPKSENAPVSESASQA